MNWNWQQADWPEFSWSTTRLAKAEERFLLRAGVFQGTLRHLDGGSRERLTVEAISREALNTSEIEGEVLDRDSVQSSVRREFGLSVEGGRASAAEQGVSEMMVRLYRSFEEPLEEAALCSWHESLMHDRQELGVIGQYRTHAEPMQIVSGRVHDPSVHFEAPPSSSVPAEMARFVEWFNRTAPSGSEPLPALTRAGIAHLYFESIHPFEDGNGRIGRAISDKALAQSLRRPTLIALSATIMARRRSYYEWLSASNRQNEITPWLAWFAGILLEAQERTQVRIEFLIDKAKLLDHLRGKLNDRQLKVLLRVLREGPEGFKGGLSAGNYVRIADTSPATARRDLGDLVEKGAVERTGERRHARYHFIIPLHPVSPVTIDETGNVLAANQESEAEDS